MAGKTPKEKPLTKKAFQEILKKVFRPVPKESGSKPEKT